MGWGLSRDAWGKGYASEGAASAIDWAFDVLGWAEVIHTIEAANTPSQAVAKRLGRTCRPRRPCRRRAGLQIQPLSRSTPA